MERLILWRLWHYYYSSRISPHNIHLHKSVLRGVREKNLLAKLLPCVFGERDFVSYGEVLRYVVVKGDNCFIFTEESDPSPLYAIPLHDKLAILEDPNQPEGTSLTISPTFKNIAKEDLDTVLLKYRGSAKIAYQFTFNKRDGSNLADGFLGVVCSSKVVVGDKVSKVPVLVHVLNRCQPPDLTIWQYMGRGACGLTSSTKHLRHIFNEVPLIHVQSSLSFRLTPLSNERRLLSSMLRKLQPKRRNISRWTRTRGSLGHCAHICRSKIEALRTEECVSFDMQSRLDNVIPLFERFIIF